ncbi:transposase [Pseudogulbenkiania subflava]
MEYTHCTRNFLPGAHVNAENLKQGQQVALQVLPAANQPLAMVCVLKDALKTAWYAPSVHEGWRRWRAWYRQACENGLAPLMRFARNLRRDLRGILASAYFPMHASLLEGVNNRIKVIKRMAYGYRDNAYSFLKIKAAFPGKAR